MDDGMMGGVPSIDAYGPDGSQQKGKRKLSDMEIDGLGGMQARTKARTLGGDRVRDGAGVQVKEIGGLGEERTTWVGVERIRPGVGVLSVPRVMSYLTVKVDGGEDILEASNFEDGREFLFLFVDMLGSCCDFRTKRGILC